MRITPACAGNSESREVPGMAVEDHPRVCGEQPFVRLKHFSLLGSPPRVRGTGDVVFIRKQATGITPACAGNRS